MKRTRTSTARPIRRGLAVLGLALTVAAGLTACDPNAPADCTKDCIQMVYASPNGDTITLAGTGAVFPEITLYSDSARTKVVGYAKSFTLSQYPTMPVTTVYQALPIQNPTKVQLKPATTYYYKAKASGAGSKVWTEQGSFKTQQRLITFTIDKIWMYDDSDFTGAGEITVDARANGGATVRVVQDLNWPSEKTHDNLNKTLSVSGSMNKVDLQVRASDDDCTFSTCTVPAGQWGAVGGNGDTQWSTLTFTLNAPPTGMDGTFEKSTQAGGVGDLGFWVWGHWTVRYQYA